MSSTILDFNAINEHINHFSADSVDKAVKAGAKAASAPAEIAENCDRIVTMLPNSPHVMSTFGGEQGLLSTAKAGTLFLDCSTIDPAAAQTVSVRHFN